MNGNCADILKPSEASSSNWTSHLDYERFHSPRVPNRTRASARPRDGRRIRVRCRFAAQSRMNAARRGLGEEQAAMPSALPP
jgi:hypothetical protein